ncbi:MAG: hypothetical protein Q8O97_01870, partial [bacterium]|nr:hypothetical protein [bacterium]
MPFRRPELACWELLGLLFKLPLEFLLELLFTLLLELLLKLLFNLPFWTLLKTFGRLPRELAGLTRELPFLMEFSGHLASELLELLLKNLLS